MVENLAAIPPADESSTGRLTRRRLLVTSGAILGALAGCSSAPKQEAPEKTAKAALPDQVVPFSTHIPNGELPQGWKPSATWLATKRTQYRSVAASNKTVLHALSEEGASAVYCDVRIPEEAAGRIRWSWKVDKLIPDADVGVSERDDAVARVLVNLGPNGKKLSFRDMLFREQAALFAGVEFPHSVLTYVWDPKHPVGTVLNIKETSRVRYLVVESGPERLGQWLEYDRDFQADFNMVFKGETSGQVNSVGVTTDSNNTFSTAEAWYGDLQLGRA
ncbi:MAG: DUF3047 domain-containing protein [Burkholderiaceae bacterium]